jgi:hypothetical protein
MDIKKYEPVEYTDSARVPSEMRGTPSMPKRALIKAAWITPVIVAVSLPRAGYAANVSGGHRSVKHNGADNPGRWDMHRGDGSERKP